jgi:type I restriction enzyme S subunit
MEWVKLEDCCEILDSRRIPITAADRKAGPYPYYGANGIQDYVDGYIFDDDLVLLAEDGGNFGSKDKPIAYRVSGKCWINNHAHVLKPKAGLDVDYLCYSLMFYNVGGMVNGATRQKLTQASMRTMRIPGRSLNDQKEIVRLLNKISLIIDRRKTELKRLDTLIKARFVEAFGDPVENPKGWRMYSLGDYTDVGSSKRIFEKEYVDEGIPFYRTKEIVELASHKPITTELYITRERYREIKSTYGVPERGDLLISAVGTIGTIWIVDGSRDFYFKDGNIIKVDRSDKFNSVFMKYLLESLIDNYKNEMSSGTAYAALTISGLSKMMVYDVPIGLQNQFADFVHHVNKSKSVVQKSLDETQVLFDSLMQKYFG